MTCDNAEQTLAVAKYSPALNQRLDLGHQISLAAAPEPAYARSYPSDFNPFPTIAVPAVVTTGVDGVTEQERVEEGEREEDAISEEGLDEEEKMDIRAGMEVYAAPVSASE